MHRTCFLIAFSLLVIVFSGCGKRKMYGQLRELLDSTIILPERVIGVYDGRAFIMPDSLRCKTKFILFVDSTECSRCRISRFAKYIDLFRLSDEIQGFVPILLVSTPRLEQAEIIEHLLLIELPFPVYLDVDHSFVRDNPLVMLDDKFSAITVGGDGAILLVGDPAGSDENMLAYRQKIENGFSQ